MARAPLKELIVKTVQAWTEDKGARLAASLSFFATLSLAPLLFFALVIFAQIYGSDAVAKERLLHVAAENMGGASTDFLRTLLENVQAPAAKTLAVGLSILGALIGASGLFGELSDAMATIWRIQKKNVSLIHSYFVSKVVSILMVLAFIVVVAAWLLLDGVLAYATHHAVGFIGWRIVSLALGTAFMTGVFAVIYKILPHDQAKWRDVWTASIITAFVFSLARFLLSLYFSLADVEAGYGPAGALVLLLLWIYYSSQIFFFGAEMVCVYAHEYGSVAGTSREPARKPRRKAAHPATSD